MTKRLLQGQELEQRARELGVDIQGSPRTGSSSGARPRAEDHELQQRVALQSLQQFRERCFQSRGDFAECTQPRLACSALQVGNVDLVDAGLLGKVDLPPALGPAQLSDALPRRRTDVLCHASMIGLAFALYLAHTLFGGKERHVKPSQEELQRTIAGRTDEELYCLLDRDAQNYTPDAIVAAREEFSRRQLNEQTMTQSLLRLREFRR